MRHLPSGSLPVGGAIDSAGGSPPRQSADRRRATFRRAGNPGQAGKSALTPDGPLFRTPKNQRDEYNEAVKAFRVIRLDGKGTRLGLEAWLCVWEGLPPEANTWELTENVSRQSDWSQLQQDFYAKQRADEEVYISHPPLLLSLMHELPAGEGAFIPLFAPSFRPFVARIC